MGPGAYLRARAHRRRLKLRRVLRRALRWTRLCGRAQEGLSRGCTPVELACS